MPTLELHHVDSFTDRPFAGNPAGVCFLDGPRETGWMQDVAREMGLSATAFLEPADGGFRLRWFTPEVELELCGHATLASAHALWETGRLGAGETARFQTASGALTAERRGEWTELDFPAARVEAAEPPPGLLAALGVHPGSVGKSRFNYFLELPDEDAVRAAAPDLPALRSTGVTGVIVTARGSANPFDFVSRYFAPGLGIDEDSVTGSAHCALAPYWAQRLGKEEMLAYQASARGGVVRVRMTGDRVKLGGQAVTVLQGRLLAS
ncbi:MAG TPA: PhzF family phenazine biosynthesis protein [Thermoanaerobaculia bacterium]